MWILIGLILVCFVAACWQTFMLEEREILIKYLRYEIKQMERTDAEREKELEEFLEFHKSLKRNVNLPG